MFCKVFVALTQPIQPKPTESCKNVKQKLLLFQIATLSANGINKPL